MALADLLCPAEVRTPGWWAGSACGQRWSCTVPRCGPHSLAEGNRLEGSGCSGGLASAAAMSSEQETQMHLGGQEWASQGHGPGQEAWGKVVQGSSWQRGCGRRRRPVEILGGSGVAGACTQPGLPHPASAQAGVTLRSPGWAVEESLQQPAGRVWPLECSRHCGHCVVLVGSEWSLVSG